MAEESFMTGYENNLRKLITLIKQELDSRDSTINTKINNMNTKIANLETHAIQDSGK